MMRFLLLAAFAGFLLLPAFAAPRVDVEVWESKGVFWAVYTLHGRADCFELIERVPGALRIMPYQWAVPFTRELPVLHFRVGTQVHSAPAIAKA